MKKPEYHFMLCNSYRVAGAAQGVCNKKGATDLLQYLTEACSDRGLDVAISTTACLNLCSQGPIMVVQPKNWWYGKVTSEEDIDEVLDALEKGEPCTKFLISE